MATAERIKEQMADKKIHTRLALLEQTTSHIQQSLDRIQNRFDVFDDKIDKLTSKFDNTLDKIESKMDANSKWLLGFIITIIISAIPLIFKTIKQ